MALARGLGVTPALILIAATYSGCSLSVRSLAEITGPKLAVNLDGARVVNTAQVQLSVAECDDIIEVLVNESDLAPSAATSAWQPCSTAPSAISYSLSPGDGSKVLRIWSKDSSGTISAHPVGELNVVLDTTAPTLSLSSLTGGQKLKGGSTQAVSWSAADANLGPGAIALELSTDSGVTWSGIASSIDNTGSYSWQVPLVDGTSYRIRVRVTDQAGNLAEVRSGSDFTIDSLAPALTETALPTSLSSNTNSVSFGGACETGLNVVVSGADSATAPCVGGAWSYATQAQSSDGPRSYVFSQTDAVGHISTISTQWIRDTVAPSVTALTINSGDAFTGTPLVSVALTASDDRAGLLIRLAEADPVSGDCQSRYADDSWLSDSGGAQTFSFLLSAGDGTKKICAWAKDAAGNVTTIAPSSGSAGVNMDDIAFQIGNPPQVASFSVSNGSAGANFGTTHYSSGETVAISWTVTDVEGLDAGAPIALSYTTDNSTWQDVTLPASGLSPGATSYSGSFSMTAPSTGYFRLKLVAKDEAGNTSVPALSDVQNAGNWSNYAGSADRGIGGGALTAELYGVGSNSGKSYFAIDPTTNDIYAVDRGQGLIKLDARTGVVSKFMTSGAANLPANGPLPANPALPFGNATNLAFDSHGLLYILTTTGGSEGASATIYQIDLVNSTARLYLGGGMAYDATATPSTVFVDASAFTFDESDSLYFLTYCTPGVAWDSSSSTVRLMKVTQNADRTPGAISVVAGNCVKGNPTSGGPVDPLTSPFTASGNPSIGSLAVWNGGADIYYSFYSGAVFKILNGQSYHSNIAANSGASVFYDKFNGKIYAAGTNGSVEEYTPNLSGADGDTIAGSSFVSASGTGGCTDDGVDAASACVNVANDFYTSGQGTLFFIDGPSVNCLRPYRIRYKDPSGKVRTVFGSKAYYGEGLDKSLTRGSYAGIYYKQASEPNQTEFPEGLYFMDDQAMVLGRIDPTTNLASILWGNQQGNSIMPYPSGTAISRNLSMGQSYWGGDGYPLNFDSNGLPWLRYTNVIASVDASGAIVERQSRSVSSVWQFAAAGSDPSAYGAYVYGARQNLTIKDQGVFFIGGYYYTADPNYTDTKVAIKYFDFQNATVIDVMGSGVVVNGTSPDNATPGAVQGLSISANCLNGGSCFTRYRADEDRLYFGEDNQLRYITTPTVPATSTLGTLFALPAGQTLQNYIFSMDHTQLFYLVSGRLYCHDLGSGKSWCNDTSLGPASGMSSIGTGPDQLTWMNATTLLISAYNGSIYQYNLLP